MDLQIKTMTQQDYMVVLLGYERIYGFEGGGLERVAKEVSEYNFHSVLETASKISLRLFAGGFGSKDNQIQLVKDIFAKDPDVRQRIVKAIKAIAEKDKVPVWAIFAEQPLLCLFKVALLHAPKVGGKLVYEADVQKVGHWLLILNDLCMGSELIHSIQLSPQADREYLREYVTRQYFFMARERMPYRVARFKNIFEKIGTLHPTFHIDQKFLEATNGAKLDDYLSFCFFLMVNWVNKTTRTVDVTKEWIVCKKKYFEQTTLSMDDIDSVLPLLLLDVDDYPTKYTQVVTDLLKGSDIFPFNFLQLRQRPLIPFNEDCFVCPSPELLMDKATDGIYWILENHFKSTGKKKERDLLPTAWGDGFEEYVHDRLSGAFTADYYKNPAMSNGEEIADGLVYGEKHLFFVETKYAHWSYKAKLTGRKEDMLPTLNQIFSSAKKTKGLGQITKNIKKMETGSITLPKPLETRKIVSVLVVGEGMPMDAFNRKMYEELASTAGAFYESSNILPFVVLDAEEVEVLEAIALDKGAKEAERILADYSMLFRNRNELGLVREAMQFKNYLHAINYPTVNNPSLFVLFDKVHKTAVKKGFKKADDKKS